MLCCVAFVVFCLPVLCVDTNSGVVVWSNELGSIKAGEAGTIAVAPAIDQNLVIAGRDGNVYAFDIDSGDEIWRDNLKGLGFHPLSLIYNEKLGVVYVGTNGTVRCLNVKTHTIEVEDFSTQTGRWLPKFGVTERVSMLLSSTKEDENNTTRTNRNTDMLFVATRGLVYALDAKTLQVKWKNTVNEYTGVALQSSEPISLVAVTSTTLGKSRGVIVAGSKAMALGIDMSTGTSLWVRKLTTTKASETRVSLHSRGGIVIASCSSKYFGVEVSTGEILWEEESLSSRSGWFSTEFLTFTSSGFAHTNTNNTHHSLWK
eukprot:TRINITY_DN1920_c0_g1_i1.p1 TRINITY_DN1920_c0_g1~~TRINITY_DN1920_c0_g1_i1.p1  ORF type:complete len:316 (-),score=39.04 TRINITY_DN1920_c0_g1_i1:19-966(-)